MTIANANSKVPAPITMNPTTEMLSSAIEHWDATQSLTDAMAADLANYHWQYICNQRKNDIAPNWVCKAAKLPAGYYWHEVVSNVLDQYSVKSPGRDNALAAMMIRCVDELSFTTRKLKKIDFQSLLIPRIPLFAAPDKAINCWLADIDNALCILENASKETRELIEEVLQLREDLNRSKS